MAKGRRGTQRSPFRREADAEPLLVGGKRRRDGVQLTSVIAGEGGGEQPAMAPQAFAEDTCASPGAPTRDVNDLCALKARQEIGEMLRQRKACKNMGRVAWTSEETRELVRLHRAFKRDRETATSEAALVRRLASPPETLPLFSQVASSGCEC